MDGDGRRVTVWECPRCGSKAGLPCVTRNGDPRRWPHMLRAILSFSYQMFIGLASRLSYQARLNAIVTVTGHEWLGISGSPGRATQEGGKIWDYMGDALQVSARLIGCAQEAIAHELDDRHTLDTSDMRNRLASVAEEAWNTAGLCLQASLEPEPAGLAGLTPKALAAELSARDLARFDQTLLRRVPAPTPGPEMTVSYHRGHIIATLPTNGDVITWTGYAPTPAAAQDVLAAATIPAVPRMRIDPPVAPVREPTQFTPGPEPEPFDLLSTLLEHGEPQLDDHLHACRQRRNELAGTSIEDYLRKRADELNAADPQIELNLDGLTQDHDLLAWVHTVQWVPTTAVLHTPNPLWGRFEHGRRPETLTEIAKGLITSGDLQQFTRRFFREGVIQLNRVPGPAGPLYTLNDDGTHRVHAARLLDLPWLLARIDTSSIPATIQLATTVTTDPTRTRQGGITDSQLSARRDLWKGLLRHGLIEGELETPRSFEHLGFLRLRWHRLPAFWWLYSPAYATRVNRAYEQRHPGTLTALGVPSSASTDAVAWTAWLLG